MDLLQSDSLCANLQSSLSLPVTHPHLLLLSFHSHGPPIIPEHELLLHSFLFLAFRHVILVGWLPQVHLSFLWSQLQLLVLFLPHLERSHSNLFLIWSQLIGAKFCGQEHCLLCLFHSHLFLEFPTKQLLLRQLLISIHK